MVLCLYLGLISVYLHVCFTTHIKTTEAHFIISEHKHVILQQQTIKDNVNITRFSTLNLFKRIHNI